MSQSRLSHHKMITGGFQNSYPQRNSLKASETSDIIYSNRRLEHINCIQEPTSECGGLYLGDIISIVKPQFVQNYQISAVLSCLHENNYSCNLPSSVAKKIITAKDSYDYPINLHFQEAFHFIDNYRNQKKNVLVHCHAGVSRSAAIVCAYLMKKCQWSFENAISFMRKRRNRVKPNQNFVKILRQYELVTLKQIRQSNEKSGYNLRQIQNRQTLPDQSNYSKICYQIDKRVVSSNEKSRKIDTQRFSKTLKEPPQYMAQTIQMRRKNTSPNETRNQISFPLKDTKQLSDTQNREFIRVQKNSFKVRKQEKTFGQLFKNKVSALLGRKTRIPWEISENNMGCISFEKDQVSLNCF